MSDVPKTEPLRVFPMTSTVGVSSPTRDAERSAMRQAYQAKFIRGAVVDFCVYGEEARAIREAR